MKKYNYVYRIIHLNPQDQRKYYIGVRSCDCLPMDDINYWSSSKSLKEAINKQGKENFVNYPTLKGEASKEVGFAHFNY